MSVRFTAALCFNIFSNRFSVLQRYRQRRQRDDVQRVARSVEVDERGDKGDRDRDGDDERGAPASEEEEHDDDHEQQRVEHRLDERCGQRCRSGFAKVKSFTTNATSPPKRKPPATSNAK